jgi:hypothetical protein
VRSAPSEEAPDGIHQASQDIQHRAAQEPTTPQAPFPEECEDDRCTQPAGPARRRARHADSIRIGYARVSTGGQNLERQLDALRAAGRRRVFAEKKSGRDTDRPELAACLDFMTPGDTLVVPSLDRLSRSLQDLITTVGDLRRRGVGFTSLHENLDTTTPGGRALAPLAVVRLEDQLAGAVTSQIAGAALRAGLRAGPEAFAGTWPNSSPPTTTSPCTPTCTPRSCWSPTTATTALSAP